MRRGYEQENLYTLSKHASEFKNKVRVFIESHEERAVFFEALRSYQESSLVPKLISDLNSVINTPKRYPLFREVRFLLKPTDVVSYLNQIPTSPSDGIRLIKLQHMGNGEIGFSVRGGKEHGVGVFVSLVSRGSQADVAGLKAGDEILSINGLYLAESTHEEVVNILRSRQNMLLKLRSTGNVPCKIHDIISWETVEGKENVYYHPDLLDYLIKEGDFLDEAPFVDGPDDKRVTLVVGPKGIGCSVRNGIPGKEGLFIISVTPGSLADRTGARIGDQIVAVNGRNVMKLRYSEAIYLLKSFKELQLVLRHSKEAENFMKIEIAKQEENMKLPEFAVKTRLLTRKAEEKERLKKAKEQMHFHKLLHSKNENDDEEDKSSGETTESKNQTQQSSTAQKTGSDFHADGQSPKSHKRTSFSQNVHVVESTPLKRGSKEITVVEVHPIPFHPSNTQLFQSVCLEQENRLSTKVVDKFEDDVLEGREAHFLTIEKVSDLGLELEERDGGIYVTEVQDHGCVAFHGGIHPGDQLLNVEGTSLLNVSVHEAHEELRKAMNRGTENIDLVVAISTKKNRRQPFLRSGSVVRKRNPVTGEEVYDTWL